MIQTEVPYPRGRGQDVSLAVTIATIHKTTLTSVLSLGVTRKDTAKENRGLTNQNMSHSYQIEAFHANGLTCALFQTQVYLSQVYFGQTRSTVPKSPKHSVHMNQNKGTSEE